MDIFTELLKAIAPIMWASLAIYAFYALKSTIIKLLESRVISIKLAGTEINLTEATAKIGAAVTDIQSKLAELPPSIAAATPPLHEDAGFRNEQKVSSPLQKPDERNFTARILWVDDYPSNNAFLIDRLRGEGHLVDLSLTTADALQRLGDVPYDGVVSDLGRKENGTENLMAGRDLIKAMRDSNFTTPVLIFASSRAIKIKEQLVQAGATDVTSSGIDVMRFVNACAMARKS